MNHKHIWLRSPRKHGRPGRLFVHCACGVQMQATISEGCLHVFTTARTYVDPPMKNYSVRLPRKPTKEEVRKFRALMRSDPPPKL